MTRSGLNILFGFVLEESYLWGILEYILNHKYVLEMDNVNQSDHKHIIYFSLICHVALYQIRLNFLSICANFRPSKLRCSSLYKISVRFYSDEKSFIDTNCVMNTFMLMILDWVKNHNFMQHLRTLSGKTNMNESK